MEWIEDKIIVLGNPCENWTEQTKDDFVSLNMLPIFTGKSNIEEIPINVAVLKLSLSKFNCDESDYKVTKSGKLRNKVSLHAKSVTL